VGHCRGMRRFFRRLHKAVLHGEPYAALWALAREHWREIVTVLGLGGVGTWFASGIDAISALGWGAWPFAGAIFALLLSLAFWAYSRGFSALGSHSEGASAGAKTVKANGKAVEYGVYLNEIGLRGDEPDEFTVFGLECYARIDVDGYADEARIAVRVLDDDYRQLAERAIVLGDIHPGQTKRGTAIELLASAMQRRLFAVADGIQSELHALTVYVTLSAKNIPETTKTFKLRGSISDRDFVKITEERY
jgi:hypothetical protein